MTPGRVAVLAVLALHCDRPVVDGGRAGASVATERAAPATSAPLAALREAAAARTIVTVHYGDQTPSGGVELTCTRDGAASGSYFNPGFSSAGAEESSR